MQTAYVGMDQVSPSAGATAPKIWSYIALIFIIFGHLTSFVIFTLDTTGYDTISLWYTSIFWTIYNAALLAVFLITSFIYIGRLDKHHLNMERAMYFYPRYQWDVLSGVTNLIWLYVFGFVIVVCIVPGLGLTFQPDYSFANNIDTKDYNTLHIFMSITSALSLWISLEVAIVYIGQIYHVKPLAEITAALDCSYTITLVKPHMRHYPSYFHHNNMHYEEKIE